MGADELDEMGPIDYLIVEWPGRQPTGEAAPILVDLVDRGVIRVIDLAFLSKGEDGSVTILDIDSLAEQSGPLKELVGASSGLLSEEDAEEAATALDPGSSAAILVYENRLGGSLRHRAAPKRRPAGCKRPDPGPGHPRRAGRRRGVRTHPA